MLIHAQTMGLEIVFSNQKFRFQNSKHIVHAHRNVRFFDIMKTQEERAHSESMNYLI